MDVRELQSALKNTLGPYINFIGVYTSGRLPDISYNTKPVILSVFEVLTSVKYH